MTHPVLENPKESKRKLLEFSNVAACKINTQKLYVPYNEQSGKEIMKIIPHMIEYKGIIYLEINLTNEVKDLYIES